MTLDLATLYEKLLESLMPKEAQSAEPIQTHIDRPEEIKAQRRKVDKIKAKLKKEKQFKKKVAISIELRRSKEKLAVLETISETITSNKVI